MLTDNKKLLKIKVKCKMTGNSNKAKCKDLDMALITNLKGRVRNLALPKSKALMPVFEAIVNSIHSIEENKETTLVDDGAIEITIVRDGVNDNLFDKKNDPIIEFIIKDNGIGFNAKNLNSFKTLDSEHKLSKGCHGIGRLLWLKIFSHVEIESVYRLDDKFQKIIFKFNEQAGDHDVDIKDIDGGNGVSTIIKLKNLSEEYRQHIPKEAETISRYILEHLLSYFISGNAPKITVFDGNDSYDLDEIYQKYINTDGVPVNIKISGYDFTVIHGKIRGKIKTTNQYSMLASNRLVREKNITPKMMTGIPKILSDDKGEFTYACYVQSEYLDQNVNAERTDFTLNSSDDAVEGELSLNVIENFILESGEKFLNDYIATSQKKTKERIEKFIEEKQPKYRTILKYLTDTDYRNCVSANDNELELLLHKAYQRIEEEILQATQYELKYKKNETADEFNRRNKELLDKITDIKKSDLASYVIRRKQVLDYLEQSIASNEEGGYSKEKIIHELIIPMGVESGDLAEGESNLWLIDERLAFHNYLASDKKISSMPIFPNNLSGKEPDVLSIKVFDTPILVNESNSPQLGAITVIEFKRPMRNDMSVDDNPVGQILNYVRNIRNGDIKTKQGRPISKNQQIPAFCYVIADLTPTMKVQCENHSLREASDGMGYFGYNEAQKAYIEVIGFDKLLIAAKERNKAFFNKLGLSVN